MWPSLESVCEGSSKEYWEERTNRAIDVRVVSYPSPPCPVEILTVVFGFLCYWSLSSHMVGQSLVHSEALRERSICAQLEDASCLPADEKSL